MLDAARSLCLGKHPPRQDPRTLRLERYLQIGDLPSPPPARDWFSKLPSDLGMMQNDQHGDCTCASAGHLIQLWTSQIGMIQTPSDQAILDAYRAVSGWDGSPTTDTGANMIDALNYWRKVGIGDHKIGAFVKLNHLDMDHIQTATEMFGGVYVGASLPKSAKDLTRPWVDIKDSVGSWGGHCLALGGYDRTFVCFATWGQRQYASWDWWMRYVDEAYAIVSQDWMDDHGLAPSGLDMETLTADLGKIS